MNAKNTPRTRNSDGPEKSGTGGSGQAPESKSAKFKRLAIPRVDKATAAIQSIGKLANTYNYDYDDTDAQKILRHLQSELDDVKQKFASSQKRKQKFSLG